MILGVPSLDRRIVMLVQQQPLLVGVAVTANEGKAALELFAVELEVEVALLDLLDRVGALHQLPRAPVPHDHVAAAVLARRDDPFEVEVVERMVLDVHGHTLRVRIECRTLRHCPAHEDSVGLESQVVVQLTGAVALDHESVAERSRGCGP